MHSILLKVQQYNKTQLLHVLGLTGPSSVRTQLYKIFASALYNCLFPDAGPVCPETCRSCVLSYYCNFNNIVCNCWPELQ